MAHNKPSISYPGDMYAELDESGIRPGFPRLAALDWPQIPSSPDAALAWDKEGILLIFKVVYHYIFNVLLF